MPQNPDADCAAVQDFVRARATSTVADAIEQAPGLVECLVTHDLIPGAAQSGLSKDTTGLRAFGLNWKDADISGRALSSSRLRGVNFTGVRAHGVFATDVDFIGCYLHATDFVDATFERCRFVGCEISKNDFRRVVVTGCEFIECDVYANWALDSNLPEGEAWWRGSRAPWDEGFCDGHETAAWEQTG